MATEQPSTIFNIETLTALGGRLHDHAEDLAAEVAFEPVRDIRLAARVCDTLAGLRFRVMEIAAKALTTPALTMQRDLFEALESAERAV
jgi:hypothetical protein